jgi:hypothetical protein
MVRLKLILVVALASFLSVGVLAVKQAPASAASTYTDGVSGFEYAFTSDEGRFVGSAQGDLRGFWHADVLHSPLTTSATITGGTFTLLTSIGGSPAQVAGSFANGGTITQISGFTGCVNQQYSLDGTLTGVGVVAGPMIGSGEFHAVLTHFRALVFGRCVTYFATVTGMVQLMF